MNNNGKEELDMNGKVWGKSVYECQQERGLFDDLTVYRGQKITLITLYLGIQTRRESTRKKECGSFNNDNGW